MYREIKTSFCIPSSYNHFDLLIELLESIKGYSEKPDEVVVSISGIPQENHENISKKLNGFTEILEIPVKALTANEKNLSGRNRNICMKNSKNDLIIFNDADDLSHPDRIQVIKKIFKDNEEVCHLTHSFMSTRISDKFSINESMKWEKNLDYKIEKFNSQKIKDCNQYVIGDNKHIHNGASSFFFVKNWQHKIQRKHSRLRDLGRSRF